MPLRRGRCCVRRPPILLLLATLLTADAPATAQTRVMALGDSITNGGLAHASYRYALWLDLDDRGFPVDFVGRETEIDGGDPPNLSWYPDYFTGFDPDHEGYWGFRTDEILGLVDDAAAAGQPDIVLVHLGTNDVGQNGAAGVTAADANLRQIIARLRLQNPSVAILLARVVPLGCCSGYTANAGEIAALNAAIDQIVADLDLSPQSPVLAVDLNTGFDLGTMMQGDGIHPNVVGEQWMADAWRAVLEPLLPGNPPPNVAITLPQDGSAFASPASIALQATASDDGAVTRVTFFADGEPIGEDTTAPYELPWRDPPLGSHVLSAVAEDDEGASETSDPVVVEVLPFGSEVPIAVSNASFEAPVLTDFDTQPGPGSLGGWTFSASANTFLGIFNPPAGSYPTAGGNGTPTGADGVNAAYLFNNGGPAEFVEATQQLGETVAVGSAYVLRVAIGRFLPDQPYVFSTYGGYRIELLAGSTVIASDSDSIDPPVGEFRDAVAAVAASAIDPSLFGQPLAIRLTISASDAPRSTHFDDVRLARRSTLVPALPRPWLGVLAAALLLAGALASSRRGARADRISSRAPRSNPERR